MYTTNRQIEKSKSYSVSQQKQQGSIHLHEQQDSTPQQENVKTSDDEGTAQNNGNNAPNPDSDINQVQQQASWHGKDIVNGQETTKSSNCKYEKFRVSILIA